MKNRNSKGFWQTHSISTISYYIFCSSELIIKITSRDMSNPKTYKQMNFLTILAKFAVKYGETKPANLITTTQTFCRINPNNYAIQLESNSSILLILIF